MASFASTPEQRNENINLNKYFISSSGDRTHNQSILQSHFVPLRHDWPQSNSVVILYFGTQDAALNLIVFFFFILMFYLLM